MRAIVPYTAKRKGIKLLKHFEVRFGALLLTSTLLIAQQPTITAHELQPTPADPVARDLRERRSKLFNTGVGRPLMAPACRHRSPL